jgi:SET domain
MTKPAPADRLDAIHQCARWIADEFTNGSFPYNTDTIEFRHSNLSNNIGVFAKKNIVKDTVLLRLPQKAVFCESHDMLQKTSPALCALVDKIMTAHEAFVESQAKSNSSKDMFYRSQGRILGPPDVRMISIVTPILFYASITGDLSCSPSATSLDALSSSSSPPQQQPALIGTTSTPALSTELKNLAKYWSAFFSTWPMDFSNLPMFWNEAEMDAIRGTSYHAYVSRLRQNVDELWQLIMQPILSQAAGVFHHSSDNDETARLYLVYKRAVGATYSRSHGASKKLDPLMSLFASILGNSPMPEHWLCPLLDCVNGAREDDALINVAMCNEEDEGPLELQTLQSIKSGDELFISYENMPNKDYL